MDDDDAQAAFSMMDVMTPPGPWLMMLEARAPWENPPLLAATPGLARLPRGDGHPVIAYPERAAQVRCVVTLGPPFSGHPRATNAWRFYPMVSGQNAHDAALLASLRVPPPVPTTSIDSRSDGVAAWQCSLNKASPRTENIEVQVSHVGMGVNPLALYAIADRQAQEPAQWTRFDARGTRRWFFRPTHPAPAGQAGRS